MNGEEKILGILDILVGKVNEVIQKVDVLEQKVEVVVQKVDTLEQTVDVIVQKVDVLEQTVNIVVQKVDALEQEVKDHRIQTRENTEMIKAIKHATEEINAKTIATSEDVVYLTGEVEGVKIKLNKAGMILQN